MYFEKLSLSAIKRIIEKTLDKKYVLINNIKTETISEKIVADIFQLDIDFETSNSIFRENGTKKGNLTMSEYFVLLNEYDGKKYDKFDMDLINKYQNAMIEELKKVDPALAEDYKNTVEFENKFKKNEDKSF